MLTVFAVRVSGLKGDQGGCCLVDRSGGDKHLTIDGNEDSAVPNQNLSLATASNSRFVYQGGAR